MNKLLLLLLFAPLSSFAQSEARYESVWEKVAHLYQQGSVDSITVDVKFFKDYFKLLKAKEACYKYPDTIYYADGFMATGYSVFNGREMGVRGLQTGTWTYYYQSGSIYSQGVFGIGAFIECQSGGPVRIYYNYEVGQWKYWHENGQLLTTGSYIPRKAVWQNTCGTDTVLQSAVSPLWTFYDNAGHERKDIGPSVIESINSRHVGRLNVEILHAPVLSAPTLDEQKD